MVPIGFLVGTAIYFVIAKLLGGTGDFGRYAYLNASFSAPLTILSSIISVIPVLGCISIFIGIYQLVLTYYSTKVEHNLTSGRALIVVLLPLLPGPAPGLLLCLLYRRRSDDHTRPDQLTHKAYD